MELKEYFLIIKKQLTLFFAVIFLVILSVFVYFLFRPILFDISIFLNITRAGNQNFNEYSYDNFYRLQADDKFAETVVEWLKSPRIVSDINTEAGREMKNVSLRQLTRVFQTTKLSSQIVSVKFSAIDQKTAEKLSLSISKILKQKVERLNEDQKQNDWFEIKADVPIIIQNKPNYGIVFVVSLLVGIFLGFWVVLIKHYLK